MENTKTYKREVGAALLLFLLGMFVWAVLDETGRAMQIAEFLTLPIFTFAGGAFAMDSVFKQGSTATTAPPKPLILK